jgi:deoxycytidine triphosphate deaminase
VGKLNVPIEEDLPGEAETEKGKREELVEMSDIQLLEGMSKDQLNEYSISRFGIDLKLSDKIKPLKFKVATMIKEKAGKKTGKGDSSTKSNGKETDKPSKQAEFIFNPKNRRVLEYTENLATRADLIPCWIVDKKGKIL